ncbi:MAG TPA: glucose-6-phosphate dehydrogenase [Anaeromyxobacteraceae bacterium]|nr:glucose-6-phosphate dehydrogenase [Anaeromyxobacteraceae bacterium]
MTLQRPGDPCAIVIFGVRGDLTRRKLLPALYNLRGNGLLPREFAIVGVGRRESDDAGLREELGRALRTFATRPVKDEVWADFRERLHYVRGDIEDPATYRRLADRLGELEREHRTGGNVLFYLATPPAEFAAVGRNLGAAGLSREPNGTWRRVVVEKPFGRDLESARALNEALLRAMREDQIFRIDHYLGKETVQNILVFRFANGIFEPVWNRRYIDHVQITVAEDIGVEGRGAFYEQAGVLRDVVQNHMFQLLALVAMEPPSSLAAEAVRNEKVKVLEAIRPMQPEEVLQATVRGQYGEGFLQGKKVPAYRDEPDVAPASKVETYAALRLQVENWRWAGVPFYLRSGKRLAARDTLLSIQFRRPPLMLFRETGVEHIDPNRLDLRIQPDESIAIQVKAKIPGPTIQLRNVSLAFSYRDFGEQEVATGYERLLHDCMTGDASLFHRSDMVEAAWRVASPILDLWESLPARDFPNYAAGTWGPAAGDDLLARDGRRWINPG